MIEKSKRRKGWLADVLMEASWRVAKWPAWKRPSDLKQETPVGKCHIVGVEQRGSNEIAVYARIAIQDDNGNRFYFDASRFNFDMTPEAKP